MIGFKQIEFFDHTGLAQRADRGAMDNSGIDSVH
jgi:hypothetical protein